MLRECGRERGHRLRHRRAGAGGVLDRQAVAAQQQHRVHAVAGGEALDHLSQLDHRSKLQGSEEPCAT